MWEKIHHMQLFAAPFNAMRTGAKNIEIRLNDSKRQKVKVEDLIEFSNRSNIEQKLVTKVMKIDHYRNFDELIEIIIPGDGLADRDRRRASLKGLRNLYPISEENKYGVVVFHLELLSFHDKNY